MRQKSPPIKVRQNSSASKFSASKIIKNINASKFCASEITPSVSASYATLRQNSMSQNSRVIVPCVKRSVRHRPFSREEACLLILKFYSFLNKKSGFKSYLYRDSWVLYARGMAVFPLEMGQKHQIIALLFRNNSCQRGDKL